MKVSDALNYLTEDIIEFVSITLSSSTPTFVSLGRLDHTLYTPGFHARPEGHSHSQASSGSPPPPWRRQSEVCCRGTSGDLQAQLWTRRAGRNPRSDTGAPLEDKGVGHKEATSVFSHF